MRSRPHYEYRHCNFNWFNNNQRGRNDRTAREKYLEIKSNFVKPIVHEVQTNKFGAKWRYTITITIMQSIFQNVWRQYNGKWFKPQCHSHKVNNACNNQSVKLFYKNGSKSRPVHITWWWLIEHGMKFTQNHFTLDRLSLHEWFRVYIPVLRARFTIDGCVTLMYRIFKVCQQTIISKEYSYRRRAIFTPWLSRYFVI